MKVGKGARESGIDGPRATSLDSQMLLLCKGNSSAVDQHVGLSSGLGKGGQGEPAE